MFWIFDIFQCIRNVHCSQRWCHPMCQHGPKRSNKKEMMLGKETLCDLNESMKVRLASNNPCWWLILFHNSRFLGSVFLQTIPIHRLSLVWPAWAVETIDRSQTPSCWTVGWNVSLSSKNDLEFDTCMCLDKVEELGQFVKLVCPVQIATSKQRNKAGWNLSKRLWPLVSERWRGPSWEVNSNTGFACCSAYP